MSDTHNQRCYLAELKEIENLAKQTGSLAELHTLDHITVGDQQMPLYALIMGNADPTAPTLGLFGGVHGVERIGTEVVLAYMHSLVEGMSWMPAIKNQLQDIRLVFMPLVNPGGMCTGNRCNPNGVDLMRNAPIDADSQAHFLLGGQRWSRHFPWYRGEVGAPMEPEAQALCKVVENFILPSNFSIALDCHSGYGRIDRIWFPYACSKRPFENAADIRCLAKLFYRMYPNHTIYKVEPQSLHYMTHGDLWDWLYKKSLMQTGTFLPLTLEMGSWMWIKKNPRQIFRFPSLFNPVLPHRHRRILRRHLILIEFLLRAVQGYRNWIPNDEQRLQLTDEAYRRWYAPHEK